MVFYLVECMIMCMITTPRGWHLCLAFLSVRPAAKTGPPQWVRAKVEAKQQPRATVEL